MRPDPFQLQNERRPADPALLARLAQLTTDLNACKGPDCRRPKTRHSRRFHSFLRILHLRSLRGSSVLRLRA